MKIFETTDYHLHHHHHGHHHHVMSWETWPRKIHMKFPLCPKLFNANSEALEIANCSWICWAFHSVAMRPNHQRAPSACCNWGLGSKAWNWGWWNFSFSLPSRELTYPTWGKGKSSSNMPYQGDMLIPWRVIFLFFFGRFSHCFS